MNIKEKEREGFRRLRSGVLDTDYRTVVSGADCVVSPILRFVTAYNDKQYFVDDRSSIINDDTAATNNAKAYLY